MRSSGTLIGAVAAFALTLLALLALDPAWLTTMLVEPVQRIAIITGLTLVAVAALLHLAWRSPEGDAAAPAPPPAPGSELSSALSTCRGAFGAVFIFSALSNVLMLTGAIFMLEVYDRVLPSRSVPTLVALAALALGLYAIQAILDIVRSRILIRIGAALDASASARVFDVLLRRPKRSDDPGDGLQPVRDLDQVRSFLSGTGPNALFDMPWLPFYMGVIYLFHPILGHTALVGAVLLIGLTALTEILTKKAVRQSTSEGAARTALAEQSRRNADAVIGMGMGERLAKRFAATSDTLIDHQNAASDVSGSLGAISKSLRMVLQSAMMGVGAWLVIHDEASAGIIIAGSILVGRALAPVDMAIAQWKYFVAARQAWGRLSSSLAALPPRPERLPLPAPKSALRAEGVAVSEPGGTRLLVRDVTFELPPGSGLAVIGASGSGKSSLARALVGAWPNASGRVTLDNAALDQWPVEDLGRHIGYLPQDVGLFSGTVAENIARLDPEPDPEAIISAARAAGVHDLVLSLPEGYQTRLGEGGAALSAGQRQRIGLARALYREPHLVVLDEPNANLDLDGEKALIAAVQAVRERGGIAVVVSHRPGTLEALDRALLMHDGRPLAFGPRDHVIAGLAATRPGGTRQRNTEPAAWPPPAWRVGTTGAVPAASEGTAA